MAYQKTGWVDHIVDPVTGEVVQQGTKVTASRMNKMEQGIADAHVLTEVLAQTVIGSPVISGLKFTVSESGLTAYWTSGVAYVNGVRFEVNAGSTKLNPTQGQYIYLDSDGVVKNTTSQETADSKCKLWYFVTDASSIITSIDGRNIVSKDMFVKQTEVARSGANKIPRLDAQGKGAFSITGDAGTLGGKESSFYKAAANIEIADAANNFTATNVEGALAELFTSVGNGKNQIKSAITAKGGTVPGTSPHTFQQLADGVKSIIKGQGNAVESQVLQGVTFSNSDGTLRTGTMPNKGAITITPSETDQAIPAGYHNGSGVVKAGYSKGGLIQKSKVSTYQVTEVAPLLSLGSPARGMWIVDEGKRTHDPTLRIVVFLANDTLVEVNQSGAIVRSVNIAGKYTGSYTACKMATDSASMEVDWVYFSTFERATRTGRLYVVDMTNGKIHLIYTNSNIDNGGWDYIGVTGYNSAIYLWLTTWSTKSTTEKFPHISLTFDKGKLGATPTVSLKRVIENDTVFSNPDYPDSTYGSTIWYAPCEMGVVAGTKYNRGRRTHFGITSGASDVTTFDGYYGVPSRYYSSLTSNSVLVIEPGVTEDYGLQTYVDQTGGSLVNYRYLSRSTAEAYRGRPALYLRDLYDGYIGDTIGVSSTPNTILKNNGLVVNASVKNVEHWSFKQNVVEIVSGPNGEPHYNEAAVCIAGTTLYKYTGEVGYFIK
ncbi:MULTISPECIES: hypothetical protein [Brevibacillus]|uniref:hypothetical protein n=1 Tax=Brevibacillus TaxID=55080 RepID=UPI000D10AFB9|nr:MULTISPECIES: hypothetical protein [Brevibacillus]MED1945843.1 hypothetical protein [Brevibacillus formosus]MED2001203.1 hypothetical protein [Brevibacillus formosus]MED2085256.1 hypothetical protein [Brevibacillus formosus]PSK11866.1 hypothetical protein C7R94_25380 [Brevibacillus sp. NRRL NRS-603]